MSSPEGTYQFSAQDPVVGTYGSDRLFLRYEKGVPVCYSGNFELRDVRGVPIDETIAAAQSLFASYGEVSDFLGAKATVQPHLSGRGIRFADDPSSLEYGYSILDQRHFGRHEIALSAMKSPELRYRGFREAVALLAEVPPGGSFTGFHQGWAPEGGTASFYEYYRQVRDGRPVADILNESKALRQNGMRQAVKGSLYYHGLEDREERLGTRRTATALMVPVHHALAHDFSRTGQEITARAYAAMANALLPEHAAFTDSMMDATGYLS